MVEAPRAQESLARSIAAYQDVVTTSLARLNESPEKRIITPDTHALLITEISGEIPTHKLAASLPSEIAGRTIAQLRASVDTVNITLHSDDPNIPTEIETGDENRPIVGLSVTYDLVSQKVYHGVRRLGEQLLPAHKGDFIDLSSVESRKLTPDDIDALTEFIGRAGEFGKARAAKRPKALPLKLYSAQQAATLFWNVASHPGLELACFLPKGRVTQVEIVLTPNDDLAGRPGAPVDMDGPIKTIAAADYVVLRKRSQKPASTADETIEQSRRVEEDEHSRYVKALQKARKESGWLEANDGVVALDPQLSKAATLQALAKITSGVAGPYEYTFRPEVIEVRSLTEPSKNMLVIDLLEMTYYGMDAWGNRIENQRPVIKGHESTAPTVPMRALHEAIANLTNPDPEKRDIVLVQPGKKVGMYLTWASQRRDVLVLAETHDEDRTQVPIADLPHHLMEDHKAFARFRRTLEHADVVSFQPLSAILPPSHESDAQAQQTVIADKNGNGRHDPTTNGTNGHRIEVSGTSSEKIVFQSYPPFSRGH